jgi:hypothetical protein
MILITVIERSELEGIFGIDLLRSGLTFNLLEQHPSVSSVRVYKHGGRSSPAITGVASEHRRLFGATRGWNSSNRNQAHSYANP